MTTQTIRDPKTDHLLTAENSAMLLIDFQPMLVDGAKSIRSEALVNNVVALAKVDDRSNDYGWFQWHQGW